MMRTLHLCNLGAILSLVCICSSCATVPHQRYFGIRVIDEQTGRGVPMVELETVNNVKYYTDSAGWIAFHEPGLMGREVFFHVRSDGYEFPADGFGNRGKALRVTEGERAQLALKRVNIAERLYRITGEGIYRDSCLLGLPAPIKNPLLNGKVLGQDTVQVVQYRGKLYWFWGDTNRPEYPLGNFAVSGATSELPGKGGLDPEVGIDLTYFTDDSGFSRGMVDVPGPGPKWIDALMVVRDASGQERLLCKFERIKTLGEIYERGLLLFDDSTNTFKPLVSIPLDFPLYPVGRPFRYTIDAQEYFYFPTPYPNIRVQAQWDHVTDPMRYEAYTCLAQGSRYDKESPQLDRDSSGKLCWDWKANTSPLSYAQQQELIASGKISPDEAWMRVLDVDSGKPVHLWSGTVNWNDYRRKWIMIAHEFGGSPSFLGEVWYAEAPSPGGPWTAAKKVVTHEKHTFYHPAHHSFFDQDGGRIIYFEGTYTETFSAGAIPTPRYNYNQIMYRLDLSDPRFQSEAR